MGLLFDLGGTFDDLNNAEKYAIDPVITDGSLFLWDLSHSLGPFSGVPVEGSTITNIARAQALALVGSGALSDMDALVDYNNVSSTAVRVERSNKGGIHVLPSQTAQSGASGGVIISPKTLVQQYLHAHTDDDWYFSLWYKLTRQGISGSLASPIHKMENTANYLINAQNGIMRPNTGTNRVASTETPVGVSAPDGVNPTLAINTPAFRAITVTAFTGTKNVMSDSATPTQGLGVGNASRGLQWVGGSTSTFGSFGLNKDPGIIIYRGYAENLTVSGRTHAEVSTIDLAAFTEAFGVGGRFHDDTTPTAPASFP